MKKHGPYFIALPVVPEVVLVFDADEIRLVVGVRAVRFELVVHDGVVLVVLPLAYSCGGEGRLLFYIMQ